jgi:hypothetical protein
MKNLSSKKYNFLPSLPRNIHFCYQVPFPFFDSIYNKNETEI